MRRGTGAIFDMHFALLCLFQPLPDVFVGVRLVLPASVTEYRDELARYFVAYPFVTGCCVRLPVGRWKLLQMLPLWFSFFFFFVW